MASLRTWEAIPIIGWIYFCTHPKTPTWLPLILIFSGPLKCALYWTRLEDNESVIHASEKMPKWVGKKCWFGQGMHALLCIHLYNPVCMYVYTHACMQQCTSTDTIFWCAPSDLWFQLNKHTVEERIMCSASRVWFTVVYLTVLVSCQWVSNFLSLLCITFTQSVQVAIWSFSYFCPNIIFTVTNK